MHINRNRKWSMGRGAPELDGKLLMKIIGWREKIVEWKGLVS